MLKSKIDRPYEKHDSERICQGDIFKECTLAFASLKKGKKIEEYKVEEFVFPCLVVLTQECDLQQFHSNQKNQTKDRPQLNQFLPHILVIPAFLSELKCTQIRFTKDSEVSKKA